MVVRADAAFAKPNLYQALEKLGVRYAIGIPSNDSLEGEVADLLTRAVGRPSHKPVVGTRASGTKLPVGRRHGGSWRRSSFTVKNCFLEWASS